MKKMSKLKARVVIYFILVYFILGVVLLTVSLVLFITAKGRVDKMLEVDGLELISEKEREKLLSDGYTEVIIQHSPVSKQPSPVLDEPNCFLYVCEAKDMEKYFAINLSQDEIAISRNCDGLQVFFSGELKTEQIKSGGVIYETLYTEDANPKVYNWLGDEFESTKEESLRTQNVIALCVAIPGVLMCLIGVLSLFFVKVNRANNQRAEYITSLFGF